MKKLRVTVDGKTYDVIVDMLDEPAAPAAVPMQVRSAPVVAAPIVAPPVTAPKPVAAAGAGSVPSPLAGKVVSIDVKIGDTVAEGAQLVTLEAMKMSTFVYAPRAGRVAAVHTAAGEAVDEGAPLVSLE